jgi:small subunit ribosomal protein S14
VARACLKYKAIRKPKFAVRAYNRCPLCGRARGYMRQFKMCRICFRTLASNGLMPGIRKSSW